MSTKQCDQRMTLVHVLHHGQPYCGFIAATPDKWPAGHKWVSQEEAGQATCPRCIALAKIVSDLAWRGPSGSKLGHVVLPRVMAQALVGGTDE